MAVPALGLDEASGALDSPFDLWQVEVEQVARGQVRLSGLKQGVPFQAGLAGAPRFFRVRPRLADSDLADYEAGRQLAAGGSAEAALGAWRATLLSSRRAIAPLRSAALLFTAMEERDAAGDTENGRLLCEAALEEARRSGRQDVVALLLEQLALHQADGSAVDAIATRRAALELRRAAGPESVAIAQSLSQLAADLLLREQPDECHRVLKEAEVMLAKVAPESVAHLLVLRRTANLLALDGELERAEAILRRVVERLDQLLPESEVLAATLSSLAIVWNYQSRAEAEDAFERVLALNTRLGRPLAMVSAMINLGSVRAGRGDLERAEASLRQALKLTPQGDGHRAFALGNLGDVQAARGDFELAAASYREAFEILEAAGRLNFQTATTLQSLARSELALGHVEQAIGPLERAIALHEAAFPNGPSAADAFAIRGELREAQGRVDEARADYERALVVFDRSGLRGRARAQPAYRLALLALRAGHRAHALELLERAVASVEEDAERAAPDEMARARLLALDSDLYRTTADLLVSLGRPADAFAYLERWRARSLLRLMAEREMAFAGDLPPELERDRQTIDARYVQARAALVAARRGQDAAAMEQARLELHAQGQRLQAMAEQVRRASPRLAAARYPRPLDLAGVQAALEPGTLLLSYSFGRERVLLFAVRGASARGAAGFEVFVVPGTAQELQERVQAFGGLLRRPVADPAEVARASSELYERLLGPARGLIDESERLLVTPDGPLHGLPFAALEHQGRYLVERKPLQTAVSVTLLQQLRSPTERTGVTGLAMAAFGDPALAERGSAQGAASQERAARLRFALDPLPGARSEAQRVSARFGRRGRAYLGAEASESNARRAAGGAERLHFATHALLDERAPLHSALVLAGEATPRRSDGDGLLEAWEVLEQVRLHADLVTLSACETGLGPDLGGEGLASLARVFQFAGARSVLASLWRVPDDATRALMDRFYRELSAGRTKDEALRHAQVAMLRSRHKQPYYWAGFQLHGERR